MKILLPVDGSPFTKKMLAYLGAHDEMFGLADEFVLIHVQSPVPPRARAAVGKELVDKLHTDETTAATKAALAYFKQKGWASRLIARPGIPTGLLMISISRASASMYVCLNLSDASHSFVVTNRVPICTPEAPACMMS